MLNRVNWISIKWFICIHDEHHQKGWQHRDAAVGLCSLHSALPLTQIYKWSCHLAPFFSLRKRGRGRGRKALQASYLPSCVSLWTPRRKLHVPQGLFCCTRNPPLVPLFKKKTAGPADAGLSAWSPLHLTWENNPDANCPLPARPDDICCTAGLFRDRLTWHCCPSTLLWYALLLDLRTQTGHYASDALSVGRDACMSTCQTEQTAWGMASHNPELHSNSASCHPLTQLDSQQSRSALP